MVYCTFCRKKIYQYTKHIICKKCFNNGEWKWTPHGLSLYSNQVKLYRSKIVEVLLRCGTVLTGSFASFNWYHSNSGRDILYYRLTDCPSKTELKPEELPI